MTKVGGSSLKFSEQLLAELRDMNFSKNTTVQNKSEPEEKGASFLDHLKAGIEDVNSMQKESDKMSMDLAAGKQENIHETMLRATQADLSFNLMVQIRNKVLEAYQEVMRMPV